MAASVVLTLALSEVSLIHSLLESRRAELRSEIAGLDALYEHIEGQTMTQIEEKPELIYLPGESAPTADEIEEEWLSRLPEPPSAPVVVTPKPPSPPVVTAEDYTVPAPAPKERPTGLTSLIKSTPDEFYSDSSAMASELQTKYGCPRPSSSPWKAGFGVAILVDAISEMASGRTNDTIASTVGIAADAVRSLRETWGEFAGFIYQLRKADPDRARIFLADFSAQQMARKGARL